MKALSISSCSECRHYTEYFPSGGVMFARCKAAMRRFESTDDILPSWCPLPDMPEVAE